MVVAEVFQREGIPGIVGTPLVWKTYICHYSVISVVFATPTMLHTYYPNSFKSNVVAYKGNS